MQPNEMAQWFQARLTEDRSQAEYQQLLRHITEALMQAPLGTWMEAETWVQSLNKALTAERVVALVEIFHHGFSDSLLQILLKDEAPVGRWLSHRGRQLLTGLFAKERIFDDAFVTTFFAQEAVEELVADMLYGALKDFSEVIPKLVQSMAPSALGKLARLGGKATGGMGGRLVDEVEKRIEPEIRRFLEKGTRRALDRAAEKIAEKMHSPKAELAVANMLDFALNQTGAFYGQRLQGKTHQSLFEFEKELAEHVLSRPEFQQRLREFAEAQHQKYAEKTIEQLLEEWQVELSIPYQEWAEATWPAVKTVIQSEGVKNYLEGLCEEFLNSQAEQEA